MAMKKDSFVVYISTDRVIITTVKNEEATLEEWFPEGDWEEQGFDRVTSNDVGIEFTTRLVKMF